MVKKFIAEFFGTFILVFMGCGSAVFAASAGFDSDNPTFATRVLLISFAFGIAIITAAYAIGKISGCHVNPAVSLAMLIDGRMTVTEFAVYCFAQFIGAFFGSSALAALLFASDVIDVGYESGLGQNVFGSASSMHLSVWGAILAEVILTFIFVSTVLGVTREKGNSSVAGLVIGFTLVGIHIVGIPLTGTSVNPARSLAPAVVLLIDGIEGPFTQVWVFMIAPFVGGALAGLFHKLMFKGVRDSADNGGENKNNSANQDKKKSVKWEK